MLQVHFNVKTYVGNWKIFTWDESGQKRCVTGSTSKDIDNKRLRVSNGGETGRPKRALTTREVYQICITLRIKLACLNKFLHLHFYEDCETGQMEFSWNETGHAMFFHKKFATEKKSDYSFLFFLSKTYLIRLKIKVRVCV